ncbi:hypothetical protein EJ110_NYTH50770 [Nymphaea thermarum]|nr:hypothetical protein EJ110_NYTH50770 [Nymphaea thermarum]
MAVEIPKEYGFVVLVFVFYVFFNFWMAFQVGKRYKVPYPTLYAIESENKDAKLFNCIQRGHQNSIEVMPIFFALLLLGGVRHPVAVTALGILYTVGRYFYFSGYSTGVPANRLTLGKLNLFALMGLMVCTISFGVHLLADEQSESLFISYLCSSRPFL